MALDILHARFAPGQIVEHVDFDYRGIIYDVDAIYSKPSEWYDMMQDSNLDKYSPWYHILVDGEEHATYVAEEKLLLSSLRADVSHPLLSSMFHFENGLLEHRHSVN